MKQTIAQELESLRAAVAARDAELAALLEAGEALKADSAKRADDYAAALAQSAEALKSADETMNAMRAEADAIKAQLAEQTARAVAAEAKLTLTPAAADVSDGQPPVKDGGAAGERKDWVAEVERRSGADRIEFYRSNRAAIDAAYEKRRG